MATKVTAADYFKALGGSLPKPPAGASGAAKAGSIGSPYGIPIPYTVPIAPMVPPSTPGGSVSIKTPTELENKLERIAKALEAIVERFC